MPSSFRRLLLAIFVVALVSAAPLARAEAPEQEDAGVADAITETASSVRALVEDRLPAGIDPQSLFEIDPANEEAAEIERLRLDAFVRSVSVDAGKPKRDAGTSPVSPQRWQARIELDRARLAFLSLPAERRAELLEHHRARVAAVAAAPATTAATDRRAEEAEAERKQALAAAQLARSEAERVVSEEYARLLAIEGQQAAFSKKLAAGRQQIDAGREATLLWERRARELRGGQPAPETADLTYDELRKALRTARDDLDAALSTASRSASEVPLAGPDPLASLQINVDVSAVHAERARVEAASTQLMTEEKAYFDERASQLLDQVDRLNAERLALLPYLSSAKHAAIIGFTTAGLAQASSEVRQLTLIARYHRFVASAWLTAVRHGHRPGALSAGAVVLVMLEWIAAFVVYFWLRPRVALGLGLLWKRARTEDRRLRLPHPSLQSRLAGFAVLTHRPVLWLALAFVLSWLLPASARDLLEVRLLSIVVDWVVGGALVVASVNALAGVGVSEEDQRGAPALRLRSLKLVGRVVVAFGLVLAITSRLVGPGTIYRWVLSTCWLASIPVFLVLVRWWRETVFVRAERARKKSAIERWVLAHRRGWKSIIAAMVGGVYLFGRGAYRVGRGWIGRFKVTRTVLAYLFRRELDKLEAGREDIVSERLPDEAFEALGPERVSAGRVAIDADEDLGRLEERLRERRGGVVAIVGALGMGKSMALAKLRAVCPDPVVTLDVPIDAGVAFADAAMQALAQAPDARAVFLDDAHHLVRPMMGGLRSFDALLGAASRSSGNVTWVLAFDEILWLFLQRARGSRPLFDDVVHLYPWREEQLVELLEQRTAFANLDPSFENLLDRLPSNADEIDRQEALDERAASYYRLLWDYAGGNPGIALHAWRRVLGIDAEGRTHVRFFQAPNAAELESLPDQTVFVLRAVLQLGQAKIEEIGAATMLQHADILDALRYGQSRGLLQLASDRYRVTWTWHRALFVFLQRRHLLVRT